jgi:hypothetical protein
MKNEKKHPSTLSVQPQRALDRRGFLRGAGTMAVGGLAATALRERSGAVSLSADPLGRHAHGAGPRAGGRPPG